MKVANARMAILTFLLQNDGLFSARINSNSCSARTTPMPPLPTRPQTPGNGAFPGTNPLGAGNHERPYITNVALPHRICWYLTTRHLPRQHEQSPYILPTLMCSKRAQLMRLKSVKDPIGVFPFPYGTAYKCYHGYRFSRKLVTSGVRMIPWRRE